MTSTKRIVVYGKFNGTFNLTKSKLTTRVLTFIYCLFSHIITSKKTLKQKISIR